jgi:anaerobic selenocysteine-containing dehydrogenase
VVYNCNPAAVAPDQAAVLAGLARGDLFTVVLEHFQTDTADYADYVLPATTQLEHWDILKPYGHLYLGLNRPAIAPVGGSLPNSEIFRRLAVALGYDDAIFRTDDETLLRTFVEAQTHPRFAPITWPKLLADGFARLDLPTPYAPFAQGNFPTPSGKCEFYSERMERDGYEQFPGIGDQGLGTGDQESARIRSPIPGPRSLICISPPAHSFLNSSFVNVPRFTKREGEPVVWIHPADGAELGVADGERVRVWNDLGEVQLTARLTADIVPGTVLAPGVWWAKLSPDGRNINQVTPQAQTDMGGGATFYDARVHIEKEMEHG